MKEICLLVLLSLCYCASSQFQVYRIGNNCTASPCYSFQQLIDDEVLFTSGSYVILLLQSGRHVIPENYTFRAYQLSELDIHPASAEQDVVIECQPQAELVFQDISKLHLSFLHFVSCTLQQATKKVQSSFFSQCVFESTKQNYAIIINGTNQVNLDFNVFNCTFLSSKGAITASISNVHIKTDIKMHLEISNTTFRKRDDGISSGALYTENSNLIIYNSHFTNYMARKGGAISAIYSSLVLDTVIFSKNHASDHGGSIFLRMSTVQISFCHFINNSAELSGGAIYIAGNNYYADVLLFTKTIFQENYATALGGAIFAQDVGVNLISCQFKNNSANVGGALYIEGKLPYCRIISSTFIFNKAETDGGGIYFDNGKKNYQNLLKLTINRGHSFSNSAVKGSGGFAYLSWCELFIIGHKYEIKGNKAIKGGAIYAVNSAIKFRIVTRVANNTAQENGGALYLINSKIYFDVPVQCLAKFDYNVAVKGGAIYILDDNCESIPGPKYQCFVQKYKHKHFLFSNNSASLGPVIYGGLLDRCVSDYSPLSSEKSHLLGIDNIKKILEYEQTTLAITSEPVRVCLCNDYKPECTTRELRREKMRGESIHLIGAVVDQDQNEMESIIRAGYNESSADLDKGEVRTKIGNKCSNLTYHIFTRDTSATLILQSEGFCERSKFSSLTVHIIVIPCSTGFESNYDRCVCDRRLSNYFTLTVCSIDTNSIKRKGSMWLRYDEQYLKMHNNCPLDFCQVTSDTISLSSPDEQCANYRSGVLCGACQDNHSIALGSSKCLHCTSNYAFIWLTVVFALMGMVLIALLLICNMTISHGTLNGLIFYANVVSTSGLTSLQNCSIHPILRVFIAWVNLDLGVETCFYSGMDTYQKTWLQFVFPLYIWLLVGAIIVASYYSSRAMKVFGRNNVAILATLFLLSYTKILKTIITALNFTEVIQSSVENVSSPVLPYKVWTHDGNLEYLKGKHVALFTVAFILLVFLFLPYTLLLTFGQCVRSMSVKPSCRWVLRCTRSTAFISIMDAYHAPYNKRHRYWTGFMLLTRCVLFLAFTSNYRDSEILANMYTITLVLVGILSLKNFVTKVYKNAYMNMLEFCFLLNLVVLSATVYYLKGNNKSDSVICNTTSASISISIILLTGILAYHAYLQTKRTRWFISIKHTIITKWSIRKHDATPVEKCDVARKKCQLHQILNCVKHYWQVTKIKNAN